MAHWQLGHQEEAMQWFDKAVLWIEEHKSNNQELVRFLAEAAALLERQTPRINPTADRPDPVPEPHPD